MNYAKVLLDLYRLKRNEKKLSAQMNAVQDKKLRRLLHFAWEHSEYYHHTFAEAVVLVFVFVVTALSAGRLLAMEQKDLGIYRAIGFSPDRLRLSFSLRFGIVSGAGSVIGSLLAILFTDPLVAVTGLFMLFAWLDAEKIRKMRLTVLVAEQ